jgi:peroxiredoxin
MISILKRPGQRTSHSKRNLAMRRFAITFLLFGLVHAGFTPAIFGQTSKSNVGASQPNSETLLRQMAEYLASLRAFSCRLDTSIHMQAAGADNRMESKMVVRLERPNRLAVVIADNGPMDMTVISDGAQLFQHLPTLSRYTLKDAPADLAEFAQSEGLMGMGIMGLSASVLPNDGEAIYKSLMEGVASTEYLGVEEVDGVKCHHCRFVQEGFNWDIWIEQGDRPLVRKIVPDMSKQFAELGGAYKDAKLDYIVTIADWNVEPRFTDADFAFQPPADAEQVESLFEGIAGGEDEGPHPLLGQPAPPFKTTDPDEKPVDLAAHLGKDVVMLDFWATWCGPCVEAMPAVDGVAKKYADRGLVFYAVNVQEDAETIKEFLKTSELELPVAMDLDGSISQNYRAEGIPQTVLIGKDGKVQVVHVGFGDGLADVLSQQVEDLMAGKDLATPVLQEAEKTQEQNESGGEE